MALQNPKKSLKLFFSFFGTLCWLRIWFFWKSDKILAKGLSFGYSKIKTDLKNHFSFLKYSYFKIGHFWKFSTKKLIFVMTSSGNHDNNCHFELIFLIVIWGWGTIFIPNLVIIAWLSLKISAAGLLGPQSPQQLKKARSG